MGKESKKGTRKRKDRTDKNREKEQISKIIEKSVSAKNEVVIVGIGTSAELVLRRT